MTELAQRNKGLAGLRSISKFLEQIEDPRKRLALSVLFSLIITFAILWLMQILIATGKGAITSKYEGRFVDFVRIQKDETLDTKTVKPKKPPEPEEPPPDTPPELDEIDTNTETVNIGAVNTKVGVGAGIGGFNAAEGEYLPIVKVAPVYPSRAQSRGIEGYCIVEYIVTSTVTTKNPTIVECTSSLFQSASLKAALKFKYKPRVINGTPIDVPGVQTQITFELEK